MTTLKVFSTPFRRWEAHKPYSAPKAVEPIFVLPDPHSAIISAAPLRSSWRLTVSATASWAS